MDLDSPWQCGYIAIMEEFLTQVWDVLGLIFGGIAQGIERGITSLFGAANAGFSRNCSPPSTPSMPWSRSTRP